MESQIYYIILPRYNQRWSGGIIIKSMNREIDGQVNETTDTCFLESLLTTGKGEINVQFKLLFLHVVIPDGVAKLFYYSSMLQSEMEWPSYYIIRPRYNQRWSGGVIIKNMNREIDGQVNETTETCVLELLLIAGKGEINVQFNETTKTVFRVGHMSLMV